MGNAHPTKGRLLKGFVVGFAVWALLGASFGFASADDGGIPEKFSIGPYRIGDEAVYAFKEAMTDHEGVHRDAYRFGFRWEEPTVQPDNLGNLRQVNVLKVTGDGDSFFGIPFGEDFERTGIHYVLPGHSVALKSTTMTARESVQPGRVFLEEGVQDGADIRSFWRPELLPCGAAPVLPSDVQGNDWTIRLPMCSEVIPFTTHYDWAELRPVDVVALGERQALLLQGDWNQGWYRPVHVSWWMEPGNPYPLKIEFRYSHLTSTTNPDSGETIDYVKTIQREIELVGLRRGTAPLPTIEQPVPSDSPALIELSGREPWGPSEEGIDHPWPLSEAFQAARAEQDSGVPEFYDDHPDAYLAEAWFSEIRDGPRTAHQWRLIWSDGTAYHHIRAIHETGPVGYEATSLLPRDLPREEEAVRFEQEQSPDHTGRPLKKDLPTLVPAAASLVDHWRIFASPELADDLTDGWGFSIYCGAGEGDSCAYQRAQFWGGSSLSELPRLHDGVLQYESRIRLSDLTLGLDQLPIEENYSPWTDERDTEYRYSAVNLDAIEGDEESDPASSLQLTDPQAWDLPSAAALAAAGLIGVLAAALYAYGPNLKGVLFGGLYSRVHRGKALDHPARRGLYELVEAQPGIHFQELARRSGKGNGTVEHHMRKLVDVGLVVVKVSPGRQCFFPKGRVDRHVMDAVPAVGSKGAISVMEAVVARPDAKRTDIVAATGLSGPTVTHHLQRLEAAGLVQRRRSGRRVHVEATDVGRQALTLAA